MKNVRTRGGPFGERPYYKDSEIENICTDELQRVDLLPSSPQPIRIDRFIEKRFHISHDYADLERGILGFTRFGKGGVEAIVVARSLDDNSTVNERRVRSTLAHEAGHGLLHGHLFVLSGQSTLFSEGNVPSPQVLCRDDVQSDAKRGYDGAWWEFQANKMIGGLLLPRTLTMKALEGLLEERGQLGLKDLPLTRRVEAAGHLADVFDVNPAVAVIRLGDLFPASDSHQQVL
jgi:hypothetical protein